MKAFAIAPSLAILARYCEPLSKFPVKVRCGKCKCECRLTEASKEYLARNKIKKILCEICAEKEMKEKLDESMRYGS